VSTLFFYGCNSDEKTEVVKTEPTVTKIVKQPEKSVVKEVVPKSSKKETKTVVEHVGNAGKGLKIYSKKLKSVCGINGGEFAKKHTQQEWDKIGKTGIKDEILKICPNVKLDSIKEKYYKDLFEFFKKFSSDSGNVPAC
jgi:hypothetical protein